MTKQTNPEALGAAEFAEMLEAARCSKSPAAELLKVADTMAAVPSQTRRAEEIRFAAKRLESNPWDADAAQTVSVRIEEFKSAAKIYRAPVDMSNDPLTVQPQPLVKRSETTWGGMAWDEVQLQNPGIIARPGEVMGRR
ncbi:hypothetical protein WK24_06555 [Burkholderia vietnamiensis]|uniref:hypothetical protein n=1 Tax=Burkholderia vietnamiensis TaxID=60552 RepID=UPI000753CB2D|nr:hypothetical protein [Burkholderia vietnamiensis]KVR74656.1 hypothetical protein WK24_06555 [Burkholderia vietnamiensis]